MPVALNEHVCEVVARRIAANGQSSTSVQPAGAVTGTPPIVVVRSGKAVPAGDDGRVSGLSDRGSGHAERDQAREGTDDDGADLTPAASTQDGPRGKAGRVGAGGAPLEQFLQVALEVVHRSSPSGAYVGSCARRASEPRATRDFDRRQAAAERLGRIPLGQVFVVAEHQRGALPGGKRRERLPQVGAFADVAL